MQRVYSAQRHAAIERPRRAVTTVGGKPLIALTGATGFIGQYLLRELPKRGYRLRVLLRRPSAVPMEAASAVVGDLARPQNMAAALADVDAVIHSAGVAHAMSGLPEDDYRVLNTEATIALGRAAQRAGAKRFIFLSSIRAQSGPTVGGVIAGGGGGLGRSPGLIPVPAALLKAALHAAGRTESYQRLAGSLVAEPTGLLKLGWKPPVTTAQALAALARS